MHPLPKSCVTCGREITYRKKWARDWAQVKYCSNACRSHRVGDVDRRLEQSILDLLGRRAAAASVCPSEAARSIGGENWRPLMERARQAARRLVDRGVIDITQNGVVVDPSYAKGPIRLRLRRL
jgi:hypothetical protein